jgi:hypothetical protein
MSLPFSSGECEIAPLGDSEWLVTNTMSKRLIQITDRRVKATIEYADELKNALAIDHRFLAVRTKSSLDIHRIASRA